MTPPHILGAYNLKEYLTSWMDARWMDTTTSTAWPWEPTNRKIFESIDLGFQDKSVNFRQHAENMQQFTNAEYNRHRCCECPQNASYFQKDSSSMRRRYKACITCE
ncbi:hypothetical protein AVEN_176085-1 [Araneus ventricosus]|uniref:Uncharacterized protein n=1 Tax=Araneus ventricosus TaxID=182803 RepID=A0A4Y2WWJ4_ARAVE|nr:hypothetical protein AVEN_25163-1 [Araneus ventricosus]GBO40865.1 hypothetical protein AVEN_31965-1 [Araneus ventricosus]GBO40867.1 hypothetical protein AVEN_42074-1 [Araneus ventricosus]GBO40870.1 hypothetical protein AVEN_176085-1 [Araneus ventricosus]